MGHLFCPDSLGKLMAKLCLEFSVFSGHPSSRPPRVGLAHGVMPSKAYTLTRSMDTGSSLLGLPPTSLQVLGGSRFVNKIVSPLHRGSHVCCVPLSCHLQAFECSPTMGNGALTSSSLSLSLSTPSTPSLVHLRGAGLSSLQSGNL
jgi:hypothetical protein